MTVNALTEMAERIEAEPLYDAGLTQAAFGAVGNALTHLDSEMIRRGAVGSVDGALLLIDHAFPGWVIRMQGVASEDHGNWHVTLRESEASDEDAFVGTGRGPKLSNVLVAALLKALAHREAD